MGLWRLNSIAREEKMTLLDGCYVISYRGANIGHATSGLGAISLQLSRASHGFSI